MPGFGRVFLCANIVSELFTRTLMLQRRGGCCVPSRQIQQRLLTGSASFRFASRRSSPTRTEVFPVRQCRLGITQQTWKLQTIRGSLPTGWKSLSLSYGWQFRLSFVLNQGIEHIKVRRRCMSRPKGLPVPKTTSKWAVCFLSVSNFSKRILTRMVRAGLVRHCRSIRWYLQAKTG